MVIVEKMFPHKLKKKKTIVIDYIHKIFILSFYDLKEIFTIYVYFSFWFLMYICQKWSLYLQIHRNINECIKLKFLCK